MALPNVLGQQFLLPIGVVLVVAVLVFAFGFNSSVKPPSFRHLGFSTDDKKSQKKKKKSQSNGQATVLADEGENRKEHSVKSLKQKNESVKAKRSDDHEKLKDKKQDNQKSSKQEKSPVKKSGKENTAVVKSKNKAQAKSKDEKPTDFDDGKWETAVSRKDKKNKKKEAGSPLTPDKGAEKKINKKKEQDKKQETSAQSPKNKKSPKNKDVQKNVPDKQIEIVLTPIRKEDNQAAKKKSKASAIQKGNENIPVIKQASGGGKNTTKNSTPTKKAAKKTEPLKEKNIQEPHSGAAVDDVGDVWKEAPQKKSKKKLRKD